MKAVADEAVKSSLKMMESLVERASRLSLETSQLPHGGRVTANKPGYRAPTPAPQSGMTSGDASDTSGALRSSDDFESIGYAYEHSNHLLGLRLFHQGAVELTQGQLKWGSK